MDAKTTTAKSRYEALSIDRKPYVERAEKCAELTIPMAFPKSGANSSTKYATPYQSVGARGVNNLTSKLMLALFPPNSPFFRLTLGDDIQRVMQAQNPDAMADWERILSQIEKKVYNYIETHQMRTTLNEAMSQLIIAGNALLYLPPKEGGAKLYRLSDYVLSRDGIGNTTEIVTRESIAYGALPDEAKKCVKGGTDPNDSCDIYSRVWLDGDHYRAQQEIDDQVIAGSEQVFPKDASPWIPLRLRKMDGEAYGRSFTDEYLGDLKSLEALSKANAEVAAVASNIVFLVNPAAVTRISELQKARAGDFIKGRLEDIQTLQINKTSDLQITMSAIANIEARLSYSFLLNSAVQRNAERVTAEEIRYVARELEDTVGNIYSILAQELQLPLVKRAINQMSSVGAIPDMPQGSAGIEPCIVTGIEALGRGHDLSKLDAFLRYAQVFPSAFEQVVKQSAILSQVATALGIDADTVIKSEEELAAEQQQQQQLMMQQQQQQQQMM